MAHPVVVEPMDEFNETLVENVHPPDWKNPTPDGVYNVVIIGAGTAGLVAASGCAGLGAKTALIERNLLGGDCLNVGCVPSKCIIRSSRVVADIRNAEQFGIRVPDGTFVDFPAVMERMRRLRSQISFHDSAERFSEMGVDVYIGEARFTGENTVEVEGQTLRFKKGIIATGARAVEPDIEGLKEAGFLTNETVFNLTERPARFAVLGAGPLGCELAQTLQRLGSQVTIIERAGQFLTREDPDAAKFLYDAFVRDGIDTRLKTAIERVEKTSEGKELHLKTDGNDDRITVDEILIGAGRAPNVEGLNLEAVGVEYDTRKGVYVNDFLQTTNPNIYAAGDICLKHKFTHTADATARLVIKNALFWGRSKQSALTIPWCTYTDPEIAHVGMYERDAKDREIEVDTFTRTLDDVDRAIADGEEEGFVKIHVKKCTDKILGATIVARHAGEMISEITLAIVGKIGLGSISNVIHPYPTQAEAIRQVSDAYNRTRLTPFLKKVLTTIMKWRR